MSRESSIPARAVLIRAVKIDAAFFLARNYPDTPPPEILLCSVPNPRSPEPKRPCMVDVCIYSGRLFCQGKY